MQLPRELSAWSDLLSRFPVDTALELGSLIFRMSVAIGPLKHGQLSGIEEPDGFEGLTSKGGIQHLLPSEWLLSDEVPIEFDRRAAMGEQLYYRLNRIDFKKGLISVLLFDAGPFKLGAPSIVHLALLILFARRAETANADFYWGILQNPETGLLKTTDKESVLKHLINYASPFTPSDENLNEWQEKLEELSNQSGKKLTIDDLHIVGDDDIKKTFSQTGLITIKDTFCPENKTLDVIIKKKNTDMSTSLELNVPPDPVAVQILRDPYSCIMSEQTTTGMTIKSNYRLSDMNAPVFSKNSLKLAVAIGDGNLELWSIPNSPLGNPGKPRHFFPEGNQSIIGVEIVKRAIRTITFDPEKIYFNRFSTIDTLHNSAEASIFEFSKSHGIYSPLYSTNAEIMFKDINDRLFSIPFGKLKSPELISERITGLLCINRRIIYASKDPLDEKVFIKDHSRDTQEEYPLKNGASGNTFFVATDWCSWEDSFGLLAINTSGRMWTVKNGSFQIILNPPEGTEV
ncbi:MAG: hypothetical protein GY795_34050, partial [Desulfobacterales bacterium]|nr:hypothetical protein [Desulfobacterales bacterium]